MIYTGPNWVLTGYLRADRKGSNILTSGLQESLSAEERMRSSLKISATITRLPSWNVLSLQSFSFTGDPSPVWEDLVGPMVLNWMYGDWLRVKGSSGKMAVTSTVSTPLVCLCQRESTWCRPTVATSQSMAGPVTSTAYILLQMNCG